MRFFLFFAVVFFLSLALGVYVHRRSSKVFALKRRARWVLGVTLCLSVVLLFGSRMFPGLSDDTRFVLAVVSTSVSLGMGLAAVFLMHVDVVSGLWWGVDRALRRKTSDEVEEVLEELEELDTPDKKPVAIDNPSRRRFVTQGSAAAIVTGMGSGSYGALFGRTDYEIETIPIPLPGLPRQLDGYTIVQLSDIHFGTFIQDTEVRVAEELVRSAGADAIVLTGDLVDHEPEYAHYVGRLVRRLGPLARDGVFAIPGNHDHYSGVEEVLSALRRGGATALVNDARGIAEGHIALLGVDDLWARRAGWGPNLQQAIEAAPTGVPRILLAHQPVFFEESAPHVQLQLSGHTHGGQVTFGYNPAEMVLPHGWVRGLYDELGSSLYVNRGFGTAGPPVRLGSAPEVTKIVLVAT